MLEELSKRDSEWRRMALHICKDKSIADEITQEMYIRVHKYSKRKPDSFYIYATLKNCFLDFIKAKQKATLIHTNKFDSLESDNEPYNFDYDKLMEALDREMQNIYWYDRHIINRKKGKTEHYKNGKIKRVINGKPFRALEAESNISTISLFNTVKKVENKLKIKLSKEYKLWQKNK